MSRGKPGLGAITIATVYGQPDNAAIFAYEKGVTMDYETLAPARRRDAASISCASACAGSDIVRRARCTSPMSR